VDGKEAVAKAANLIFVESSKRHNLDGELDYQLEPRLNQALQIVGMVFFLNLLLVQTLKCLFPCAV